MGEQVKILVADDESRMRELVKAYLQKEDFTVEEAANGREVLEKLRREPFNLVILDLMMPELDGWKTCQEIRKEFDLPIIMLTARGEELDRVLGFELGADDYVVKPFSPRELVLRVKALLRRVAPEGGGKGEILNFPGLSIDRAARQVRVDGETVNLTPKEFDLLFFLASNRGRVFSREQLLERVWGYDFYGDLRTVDTHVKNLREKLGRHRDLPYIRTVWGVGYKFEVGP